MPFQTQVNAAQAPGAEGDFASVNPRYVADAGPGGLLAGAGGISVGRFVWRNASPVDTNGTPTTVSNTGSGAPFGLVGREWQGLVTTYGAEGSTFVPAGFAVTVFKVCDMWVKNTGAGPTAVGQAAFAKTADGTIAFAAVGGTVAGAVETPWIAQTVSAVGEPVKIERKIG